MAGVFERNRIQLQNLARRKAMEKQAAAAREASRAGEAALENGFTVHFNGANREVGRQQQQPLQQPARPDTGARVLRVRGGAARLSVGWARGHGLGVAARVW